MKNLIAITIMVLSSNFAKAQDKNQQKPNANKPEFVRSVEGTKEYILKNGLKVLLIEDTSQSNAVVNIIYNVGSRHEGYGEKGMAHLLEHMLFKSSKKFKSIKKSLSEKTKSANGTTWYDRTNYYEVFPGSNENLKWAIELEADRMVNADILQSDLDKEFSVVRNEFEIGENEPTRVLQERVLSMAYIWHNYGNSTIGSKEDIERVNAERLRVFYKKHYQPDNATVIIAGNFDQAKAIEYCGTILGAIPKPKRVLENTYTVEPPQDGERYVELKRKADIQIVSATYHTSSFADEDYAAVVALSEMLTSDPSGYLYKDLVETQKATSIHYGLNILRDPGFNYFSLIVPKDKDLNDAKITLLKGLDKIATIAYTQEDLTRAKNKILKALENTKNNTIGFAIGLTEYIGAGDYRLWFVYRDRVEALQLKDVKRVAQTYFKATNRTVGIFTNSDDTHRVRPNEISNQQIGTLLADYKGRVVDENFRPFEPSFENLKKSTQMADLKSGMKYAIVKKSIKGEKVVANFVFPVGNPKALEHKSTAASMMASLIKGGTKTKTKTEIQDLLDKMKSSIGIDFSGQELRISINTYQKFFEPTMSLLKELLTEATFPENEIQKEIAEWRTGLEYSRSNPRSVASLKISQKTTNYPKGHIFYAASIDEDLSNVNAIKKEALVECYKMLSSAKGIGTIVGDIDKQEVDAAMMSTFENWTTNVPYEEIPQQYFDTKSEVEKVNIADKENAVTFGAINLKMNLLDKDAPAMMLACEMLGSGGFLNSRIPMRLREKEGISYGAGAYIQLNQKEKASSLGFYAFFNPAAQQKVETAFGEELSKALKDGFTEAELKESINSWLVSLKSNLGSDSYLISLTNAALLGDVSVDDRIRIQKDVEALDVKSVNAIFKKYVGANNITWVYAGNFDNKK